ncbi:MAG: DUF4381 domain-containing protein [Nitrospirales bacterium]|nr:DUF4381 domain-containing protein [Nitrospira sp.]MDR4500859.1 DUF4381 domain-containing protein [Nitrospirales bacterium]
MDSLDQLRGLHLPPPVSFWPPAIGWWIVAGSLLALLALGLWFMWYRKKTALRRDALQKLLALKTQFTQTQNCQELMSGLSQLLRRYALSCFGRQAVAGLTGLPWLRFLDEHAKTHLFSDAGSRHAWLEVPYGLDHDKVNGYEMIDLAERWIKQVPLPSKRMTA